MRKMYSRSAQIEKEYQQIRNSTLIKASQYPIEDINSIEDFNEYLTKDKSSEC